MSIVDFKNVSIEYRLRKFTLCAVKNVDLSLEEGKITALVGESGSGKTTLATSLLNCISEPGVIAGGQVLFHGKDGTVDVGALDKRDLNRFRWNKVSMVFQGAQSALNPVVRIFDQFYETLQVHSDGKISKEEAMKISRECLKIVNLDADRVLRCYPHELSGGMKQRVMIAFALLLDPNVVILDEPTTALDVITQDYIFSILRRINRERNIAMLLLTHDIAVVSKYADYVAGMYGGRIMEYGTTEEVFSKKEHPYTEGLINATPSLIKKLEEMRPIPGAPPNLLDMPLGCVFHPRCPYADERCGKEEPPSVVTEGGSTVKCWRCVKENVDA